MIEYIINEIFNKSSNIDQTQCRREREMGKMYEKYRTGENITSYQDQPGSSEQALKFP